MCARIQRLVQDFFVVRLAEAKQSNNLSYLKTVTNLHSDTKLLLQALRFELGTVFLYPIWLMLRPLSRLLVFGMQILASSQIDIALQMF